MVVQIDETICNGFSACSENGVCRDVCALGAIVEKDGRPSVKFFSCSTCGICITNCPNGAISKK